MFSACLYCVTSGRISSRRDLAPRKVSRVAQASVWTAFLVARELLENLPTLNSLQVVLMPERSIFDRSGASPLVLEWIAGSILGGFRSCAISRRFLSPVPPRPQF